jgi:PPOX class probable F420-dependent enzyme
MDCAAASHMQKAKGQLMADSKLSPEVRAFLEERRFGVLATINPDGSPQQTVMWYALEGDTIMMNTLRGRQKDRNLLRDPRASISIEDEGRFVTVSGAISVDENPARGQQTARELAVRYDGEEGADDIVTNAFSKQHRVTLDLSIDHVIAHGF